MHPGFPEFPETVELPAFIKAEAYAGSRPGFYFGTGDRGLGYYFDFWRFRFGAASETYISLNTVRAVTGGPSTVKPGEMHYVLTNTGLPNSTLTAPSARKLTPRQEEEDPSKKDRQLVQGRRPRYGGRTRHE